MRIELRIKLSWEPPEVDGVANAFCEAAPDVSYLTGENEGSYELTNGIELVDTGPSEVPVESIETEFEVVLEYDRIEGKFASKEELTDQIIEEWGSMGEFEYNGMTWSVEDVEVIDRKAEAAADKKKIIERLAN